MAKLPIQVGYKSKHNGEKILNMPRIEFLNIHSLIPTFFLLIKVTRITVHVTKLSIYNKQSKYH